MPDVNAIEALLAGQGIELVKETVPAPPLEAEPLAPVVEPEPISEVINPPPGDLAPVVEPEPLTPIVNPPPGDLAPVHDGRMVDVYRLKQS